MSLIIISDPTKKHLKLLEFEVISLDISKLSSLSRILEERVDDDFYCIVCFIELGVCLLETKI